MKHLVLTHATLKVKHSSNKEEYCWFALNISQSENASFITGIFCIIIDSFHTRNHMHMHALYQFSNKVTSVIHIFYFAISVIHIFYFAISVIQFFYFAISLEEIIEQTL